MAIDSIRRQRFVLGAFGLAVLLGPIVVLASTSVAPAPRVLAGCNDVVETTDSFSMNCVPQVIPDVSDQLTEAEVAEPGWNAVPGGAGAGHH